MAFSPETYALLLKKIEEGGGGGGSVSPSDVFFYVRQEGNTLDKTWSEIKTAFDSGKQVFLQVTVIEEENVTEYRHNFLLINITEEDGEIFVVSFLSGGLTPSSYEASSADSYPVFVD